MTTAQNASMIDSLRSGVNFFLDRTNQNSQAVKAGLDAFWEQVKPDIYQLLIEAAAGQPVASESLELFADAAAARASRLGLEFAAAEQAALGAVVMTGLKTAISLAVVAAV
jgi:hypothetical protein